MKGVRKGALYLTFLIAVLFIVLISNKVSLDHQDLQNSISKEQIKEPKVPREENKAARSEYFFRMLKDPVTNRIPKNIRDNELNFARQLPQKLDSRLKLNGKAKTIETVSWEEIGPNNVGGRTRALVVDVDDPNTIIAGGVSGGIWKSTDNGESWVSKTPNSDRLSVSWLVQDITSPGNDTWYYATGEFDGNSAGAPFASFFGYGVFQSTDNGETWSRIPSTNFGDDTSFNSPYDFISRLAISPTTGTLFMGSNFFGVYRFNENTQQFDRVLGATSDQIYVDVTVNRDGELLAVLSSIPGGTPTRNPGFYISTDDGLTWTDKTPPTFPEQSQRSFATFAPSAPDTAYVITYTGMKATTSPNDSVHFHMIELDATGDTVQTEDRSVNMPDFGEPVGEINQSNYDMIMAVKPDDPEFVLLGFTNLYRSRDAFKTPANDASDNWIGGYSTSNNVSQYPGQHPDQHSISFDPANPNRMWAGHDGGLSYTTDISVIGPVTWQNKNNGYNVTQFYHVSIPDESGDQRVAGGTQDNGTPIFFTNVDMASQADASTGDGAYSYFGDNFLYASSQRGNTRRYSYNQNGLGGFTTGNFTNFANISPPSASDQLFINPFAIDPNDETVIFYPAGDDLWRNTDIEDTNTDGQANIDDWEQLTNLSPPSGSILSALAVTKSNPNHRLYYAAFINGSTPQLFRIDNANTTGNLGSNLINISIPGAPSNSYIVNIAVNPNDGDELIVVMGNYNIVGLYHSVDAGATWTAIEGNLEGSSGANPSLRDAAIIPLDGETLYMVATSTGVYSTKTLNGSSTVWAQEGASTIGNVVAVSLAHRTSDNTLVVGTHGRGIFGKIPKEREIAGNAGWRMMSAPVQNMPISDITDDTPIQGYGDGFERNFYEGYDGTNFTFPGDLSGNLTSGLGFIIYMFDNNLAGSSALPTPINSEGAEPSGDVTVNLHASGDRFNLLGNPYNAPIDFNAVTLDEVENAWWVWDDATSQYLTYNGTTGVSETNNNGHIAPWQGFFVRSQNGAASPSVTFSQDAKAHYNAQFYKPETSENVRTIRLNITGRDLADNNTVAVFYKGGLTGDDPGDMEDLTPLSDRFVNLSFVNPDEQERMPLANDARSYELINEQKFYLQFNASESGTYTIRWKMENIPDTWLLELYDRDTEQVFYLKPGDYYRFDFDKDKTQKSKSVLSKAQITGSIYDNNHRFELRALKKNGEIASAPDRFALSQNYPNPFNPSTSIPYEVPEAANVKLEVFNSIGQKVAILVNEQKAAGFYRTQFDASRFASGIYFVRLQANSFVQTKSMTLIK